MNSLLCFLLLATFSLLPIQSFVEAKTHSSFTVDLIHRDSSLSPFYNHSATPRDLARNYVHRAIARANYFSQTLSDTKKIDSSDGKRMEVLLNPTLGAYLMKFYVGTPKVEVLALADTGSDLSWIQCLPCDGPDGCYKQTHPLFDPNNSSTYSEFACRASPCPLTQRRCLTTCPYESKYRDGSYSSGVLASDIFAFDSTDGHPVKFPNFRFGCGHNNTGLFDINSAGVVGLGGGQLSLVSQLGDQIDHKFSYCLQPITAKSSSKLRFGTGAVISGEGIVSTPILQRSDSTQYYLNLEGVSVGDKKIVNKQSAPGEGNTIIDSGTTLTVLHPISFYFDVEAAVKEAVGLKPVQERSKDYTLCYDITSFNAIPEMTMVFHFTGADVTLKKMNIFQTFDGKACLAIIPTDVTDDTDNFSIFGNVAQTNFRVEYDLANKQVSFAPADCTQF